MSFLWSFLLLLSFLFINTIVIIYICYCKIPSTVDFVVDSYINEEQVTNEEPVTNIEINPKNIIIIENPNKKYDIGIKYLKS